MDEISFTSGPTAAPLGISRLPAKHSGANGRPCVVMAPGFASTRPGGLVTYAEGYAAAGFDVVLFDYRSRRVGWIARQLVSASRQRQDYHAAIAAARRLPGVDPERIVLWGISFSGGHVLRVAAEDGRIAAVMSVTPAVDGVAVLAQLARNAGALQLFRVAGHGLRDAIRGLTRRPPHFVPVIGEPGSRAIIAKHGAEQEYTRITGPSWRNEVCARTALGVAFNRPIKFASRVFCPLLVQAGTADSITPPARARRAAASARRAELREYPIDHLDAETGPAQQHALVDQLDFLHRHLAPTASRDAAITTTERNHQ
jgi:dienelactone hydrolase